MFLHNLKYLLKILFRDKILIFIIIFTPIILSIFFYMAFSNINKSEKLTEINLAIVNDKGFFESDIYKEALNNLEFLNIDYLSLKTAKKKLDDQKIVGYLEFSNKEVIFNVKSKGINQTIVKDSIEEVLSSSLIINTLIKEKRIDYNEIINKDNNPILVKDLSKSDFDYMTVEYYTLIAMSCLFGAVISMVSINNILPNMSNKGKRIFLSSINKSKLLFSSLLSSFLVQLISLCLLLLFLILILKISFGPSLLLVILISIWGSIAGLASGVFISSFVKSNENLKTSIIIAFTMISCFLSGMMGVITKYYIDKYLPLLNKINPANMITDGLYSLYYYDTFNRYFFNLISLIIYTVILVILSFRYLRSQKYDSL